VIATVGSARDIAIKLAEAGERFCLAQLMQLRKRKHAARAFVGAGSIIDTIGADAVMKSRRLVFVMAVDGGDHVLEIDCVRSAANVLDQLGDGHGVSIGDVDERAAHDSEVFASA